MSRIGNKIINIPEGVTVTLDGQLLRAKNQAIEKSLSIPKNLKIEINGNDIQIKRLSENKASRSLHGLYRVLISNLLVGIQAGFTKGLEFKGIGYRAVVNENKLVLNTGYSHPVELEIPDGIKVEVKKATILVSGSGKYEVGEFAAKIRAVRKPEVYKGKGIRYSDEHIKIKPGKTAAKGA